MNDHNFLNISNNWLLHTATHLFTKSVSWLFSYIHYGGFWVHGVPKEVYTSEITKVRKWVMTACLVQWLARLTAMQEVPGSIPGYTLQIFLEV